MKHVVALLGFLLLASAACVAEQAEDAIPAGEARTAPPAPPQNLGDLDLHPISELTPPIDAEPMLMNAEIVDPAAWPASFFSRSAGGSCTSTLVGPRVLLTAAHCVGNGRKARISWAGEQIEGVCTHSPDYRSNSADWALCLMDRELAGIPYETLNDRAEALEVGTGVLLTGFGCTQPDGSSDGHYRTGPSAIHALPAGDDNFIETRRGAVLCFGDSGGPAFLLKDGDEKRRRLVGVNSSVIFVIEASYLSSVTTRQARRFFVDWSRDHGVPICGLSPPVSGCRD